MTSETPGPQVGILWLLDRALKCLLPLSFTGLGLSLCYDPNHADIDASPSWWSSELVNEMVPADRSPRSLTLPSSSLLTSSSHLPPACLSPAVFTTSHPVPFPPGWPSPFTNFFFLKHINSTAQASSRSPSLSSEPRDLFQGSRWLALPLS